MSNNNFGQPVIPTNNSGTSPAISPFFVAKYDDRTVAMRRNTDFAATITSLQRVFSTLQSLDPSCIRISAEFQEFGGILVELYAEIWSEVVPRLTFVEISTGDDVQQEVKEQMATPRQNEETLPRNQNVKPEPVVVHVRDTHGNIKDLTFPLFSTCTIRQLKDLIVHHNNQLPQNLLLNFEEHPILEDHKQLHEYGIKNESTVLLTTEFEVYLVGYNSTRFSVNIVTFASIATLKMLYLNLIKGVSSSSKYYDCSGKYVGFELSCGGEALDEAEKLGSFNHLAPGCEIFVNEVADSACSHAESRKTIRLDIYDESQIVQYARRASISPSFQCWVFPESTILDLKLLISNKNQTSPSRRARKFELTTDGNTPFQYPSAWQTVQSYNSGGRLIWLRNHDN